MRAMMKIWVSGASGQVGTAITDVADPLAFELLNTDVEELDITEIDEVLNFAELNRPDVIINCAGMTDVALCEKNPELAYKVNALGARNLSIAARKIGAKLVQISTDDVFDGQSSEPYCEFDDTNPKTVYGRSKRAGENYVKEFTEKHFIIRSNWIYGKGKNFVSNLLERVKTEHVLPVASDQFGSPTSANDLARLLLELMDTNEYGTYHITAKGTCSRYEFAKEILRLTDHDVTIQPVPTKESEFSSVRPAYAVLDNFILRILNMQEMPEWRESLKIFLKENYGGTRDE